MYCSLHEMLGFVDNAIGKLARKLDIDCAQAMMGWEAHSGYSCPQ